MSRFTLYAVLATQPPLPAPGPRYIVLISGKWLTLPYYMLMGIILKASVPSSLTFSCITLKMSRNVVRAVDTAFKYRNHFRKVLFLCRSIWELDLKSRKGYYR